MIKSRSGFTIVELLIVIVVIAILAAISIVAYNGIQTRARVAKANSDLASLQKAIMTARIKTDRTLFAITGNGNTWGDADGQAAYISALDAIAAAGETSLDSLKAGDPWGVRYRIDENEGETTPCNAYGRDIITVSPGRADVPDVNIPYYNCP